MNVKFTPGLASVIIPTYNRAKLLKEGVLSVHSQTYRPIECIVVDDGSTDATRGVMKELQRLEEQDFSIRYLPQAKAGSQMARNTGTYASQGEFIQYLDSDDLLYPGKIAQQVEYLLQHPGCDGVFGDWHSGLPGICEYIQAYASDDLVAQFLGDRCIANFSFLMRRDLIKKIGGWDPMVKRNQEIDFHIRGLMVGGQFNYLAGCTGLWRQHTEERIANTTKFSDILFFYQKMERLLKEHGRFTEKLAQIIASHYDWRISGYNGYKDKAVVAMMKEAVRLKPDIAFMKSRKLRFLTSVFGQDLAFYCWTKLFVK